MRFRPVHLTSLLAAAVCLFSASGAAAAPVTGQMIPGAGARRHVARSAEYRPVGLLSKTRSVPVARPFATASAHRLGPLRRLHQADLLIISPTALPHRLTAVVRRLPGVAAAQSLDAARIKVDGTFAAMLGVNPSSFRAFAPRRTARSRALWQNVAAGGMAASYTMGRLDKLPLGQPVPVAGRQPERLRVAGFGTVGINGIDAVVSDAVARSLGFPVGNAIVVSAPGASLTALTGRIKRLVPRSVSIVPLVAEAPSSGVALTSGEAGIAGITGADGPGLTRAQLVAFLRAAISRLGKRYVWGGSGPNVFDCSGLVQWSLAQAGIVMPRVAVDQARTGPPVPLSDLQPGDLLFYHTDPTDPSYISHVAIYLGNGEMIQAPEPGLDVQIVPAAFGPGFAGAVRIYPRIAADVAAQPVG